MEPLEAASLPWAQVRPYAVEYLDSTTYKYKLVELCGNDRCNFIYIDRAEGCPRVTH
jgi:hypothetical protein